MQTFRFVFLSVPYHIQTPIQSALHTLLIAAVVYTYCFIPRKEKETQTFIGYVGFHNVPLEMSFAPAVEIGWRLHPDFWGKGYATEAATACLDYARRELKFKEIYSFTSLPNKRSERVMQKIGMSRVMEFGHPLVEPTHPLYKHILYKIDLV